MKPAHDYLFDFAASYSSGGLKRLQEYARWFDGRGGASFVLHPNCENLREQFPRNRYFVARQSRLSRFFNDGSYLRDIVREHGTPELRYSYGIPLYERIGRVDWFHLSNVLPMMAFTAPLAFADRLKFALLGRRVLRGCRFASVISAESASSVAAMPGVDAARTFVSVNGSDEELAFARAPRHETDENLAIAVGTYFYKALGDTVRVFEMLRARRPALELHVFGNPDWVPHALKRTPGVHIRGNVARVELISRLERARFYLSTTLVENSWNAASEGVFLAAESYVSDIGPHRELFGASRPAKVRVPGVARDLLHVERSTLDPAPLKTWATVVGEMLARHEQALRERKK